MNFDNSEQVDALAKLPPEPPKPAERSIWSLVPRAIAGGAAKVGAATVDALDTVGDAAGKRKAFERQGLKAPETDLGTIATSARDFERDMRPDPVTAGTAEQLVYGAVSGLTAAGLGAVLGGAPGAAIGMGAAEGAATADDLRRQGVDPTTARNAGLVVGGVGAASVALPMAGPTLKATAGLYLAGGPAGYMAQQAAVSQILSGAGYAKIAEQYDPLDPVGLAVSALVPLPFAGYGAMRNVRAARAARAAEVPPVREPVPGEPVKPAEPPKPVEPVPRAPETAPEVVDAAMVHNLTLQRQRAMEGPPPDLVAAIESTQPAAAEGAPTQVVTERGLTVPVQYRLVEADSLVTSHSNDLQTNPAFPAELQPRDRTRAASSEQIARIEGQIRPELLGESVKASDGAPIIGPDAVVESGNARTIALRRAYESGKADGYRAWLEANAGRFGLQPEEVQGMRRPVLVRERIGQIDRAEFARQANESPIAALSPVEQARADAARMRDLSGLVPNDDGTINMSQSRDWVRGFMADIPPTERGAMMQSDGQLSQVGVQRIRNAVFAKAYGDPDILAALAESTSSNIKNILAGLLRAAPDVARLQDLIAAGAREPMDFAGDLVRAVRELGAMRERGMTVKDFLSQGDLLGDGLPASVNNLLIGLSENARSPKRVAEMVRMMVDAVDKLGDPRQASMFDAAGATKGDVSANAVERMRTLTDEQLAGSDAPAPKAGVDALVQSVNDRMAALEVAAPDMVVRLDADGNPITLRDELARIRRESAEGTDTTLGGDDAPLVQVAATCALSMGA